MRRIGVLLAVLALIVGAAGCDYIPRYELYIGSTEGGSVTVPGEGTFGKYGDAESVKLVAKPDEGYEFDRWTGDVRHIDDVRAANTTITMWDDYSIKANFKKVTATNQLAASRRHYRGSGSYRCGSGSFLRA